jgi:hypothetical protein
LRKVLIGITPLIFSLAACSQSTPKPSTPAASTTTAGAPQQAGMPAAPEIAPPAHPITDAQVQDLMQLTGTDKIKDQLTEYFMQRIAQAPFMPKDVIDDLHTSLEKTDVNTAAVATYKKYLSSDDAATIIAFYKTPAGKDLVKVTPHIMSEVERSAMQTGQQVAKEVIERHRPEIEAAQKAYQAQHAPPSLGAPTPTPGPGAKAPAPAATPTPATTPKPATPQG